ncbi:Ribose-5-phosphate isomerase A [Cellulophaga algicola DSM 14237]|uniref:Ribose-5-phosphate isomerase A n=1 Tax=Cellulophaga algicola (strain DSM 14237 / IC166 / ACAM 630) TaxID=688270 RepID=E6X8C9_CELAD|nr:ribose-5-phosphate isomerase RpiA [Cellulophaga algicola]ADV50785.1 Ribose-5-phosphate isomerase A [Cellulophaga algicola DSM 14237]
MNSISEKELAAIEAVKFIKNNMTIGLGTGSTAAYMITHLGERIKKEGLIIYGVPTSEATEKFALKNGIKILSLEEVKKIDITIDGADEFDTYLQLIKGGGGALLREKIIASNSEFNIIIADSGKQVSRLGAFRLPIETVPFATKKIADQLHQKGLDPILRKKGETVFSTDEKNYILDVNILPFYNLESLNQELIAIPGIVETGLFLTTTDLVLMGKGSKVIHFKKNKPNKKNRKTLINSALIIC